MNSRGKAASLILTWLSCWCILTSGAQNNSVKPIELQLNLAEVHSVRQTGEILGKSKIFIDDYAVIRAKSGIISPINRKKIPPQVFHDIPGSASKYKFSLEYISDSGSHARANGEVMVLSQSSEEKSSYIFKELTGVEMSDVGTFRQWRYHSVVITIPMARKHWTLDFESDMQDPTKAHGKLTNGLQDIQVRNTRVIAEREGMIQETDRIVFIQEGRWLALRDLDEGSFVFRKKLEPEVKLVLSLAMASLEH